MTVPVGEHEHGFDLFGTRVRLLVGAAPARPLQAAIDSLRVQARLQALHRALTRFHSRSELSRLNARSGTTVEVSPALLGAIEAALHAARTSHGLVDPTVLPDLERAGYAASRAGHRPADLASAVAAAPPRRPASPRPTPEWPAIDVDPAVSAVRLPAGVRMDLGGTAKGMAVDIAARMLADHASFAVDAGGDIRLGGARAPARIVRIADPFSDDVAHELVLTSGAIATSGLRTRLWRTPDGYAHHLIDPATGRPAWTGVIQATALAPTALETETLAKTALLRGPAAGRDVLRRHGGALILDDGELVLVGDLEHMSGAGPALPA
jgi:thiamine biosynthesis lipoprotein